MQNTIFFRLGALALVLLLVGCDTGYQKIEDNWFYVTVDEGHGRRERPLTADVATFHVLENKAYARDKDQVWYQGQLVSTVDPATFELLNGGNYARDKDHIYLFTYPVINADPTTFEALKFPYARDANTIFCGTLPMQVGAVEEFKVKQSSKGYSITLKEVFTRDYPEYAYLDSLPVQAVVTGYGSGHTKTEEFDGFQKVE